jgi:hypothetical protein
LLAPAAQFTEMEGIKGIRNKYIPFILMIPFRESGRKQPFLTCKFINKLFIGS